MHILSKANTHRMVELWTEQHLAWRHVIWMGELNLERTHQRVKQSIKKSNGKEEQILAVNALRFNDWQGRLRSIVIEGVGGPRIHMREGLALLTGRGNSQLATAVIPEGIRTRIKKLLHNDGLAMGEIKLQGQLIYGKHSFLCGKGGRRLIQRCLKGAKLCAHKELEFEKNKKEL